MTDLSKGRQLHQQALDAQEEGNFEEALKFVDAALVAYADDKDELGFSEAHTMRYLTLNHLHQKTGFKGWLISAKYSALAGVELARSSGNKDAFGIPLFHLAQCLEDLGEYDKALGTYKESLEAIDNDSSSGTNYHAYKANIRNHMEVCAFKNGDNGAIERAQSALDDLARTQDGTEYDRMVWMSGGYLRIAYALREKDVERARVYLKKAKIYIEAHPELKLRKEQLNKITEIIG